MRPLRKAMIQIFYRISFWAAVASLPFVFFFNSQLFVFLNCNKTGGRLDWVFLLLTSLADGLWMMMIATVVHSLQSAHSRQRSFGIFIIALVLGSILLQGGKFLFEADRPLRFWGEARVCVLGQPLTLRSFPSGHSFSAILLFMYLRPRRSLVAAALTLLLCVLAVISRAYVGAHFPRDMIAGSLIAVASFLFAEWVITKFKPWSWGESLKKNLLGIFGLATALVYIFFYHEKTRELEFLLTPAAWVVVAYWFCFFGYRIYRFKKAPNP
jgi:membrane-associated phospholipid phosphatase